MNNFKCGLKVRKGNMVGTVMWYGGNGSDVACIYWGDYIVRWETIKELQI